MFIPSALLGFVIGMTIWIINLIIIRLYSSARKGFKSKMKKENPTDDFDLKLKMTGAGEDLWKNIRSIVLLYSSLLFILTFSDAEKVNAVDGSYRYLGSTLEKFADSLGTSGKVAKKGDRVRGLLSSELGMAGGSARKLRRPLPDHLLQVLSASEGKPKGMGRRRIYS